MLASQQKHHVLRALRRSHTSSPSSSNLSSLTSSSSWIHLRSVLLVVASSSSSSPISRTPLLQALGVIALRLIAIGLELDDVWEAICQAHVSLFEFLFTPFDDASNPIIAQAAFLATLTEVEIAEAAASAAVKALTEVNYETSKEILESSADDAKDQVFNNKYEKNARRFGIDKFKTYLLLMVKKTKATLKHIVTLIHLQKLKIGKVGITEGIVNGIHERWRRTVLVKIVYEDLCGHCKNLAPEGKKAAKNLQGKVKLGHVNCDDKKFKVQGFPTILVFGADKESPITYEGARTASAIESFALVQLETNVAPSEVTKLTSLGTSIGLYRVSIQYKMKDVQKLQPSEAQFYYGIMQIPWIIKPLWGLMTDIVPIFRLRKCHICWFNRFHGQWRILEFFMLGELGAIYTIRNGSGFLQSCMALWKDPQGRALVSWYGGVLVIEKGVKGGDILSAGICVLYGGLCELANNKQLVDHYSSKHPKEKRPSNSE
ncbi:hypothetical protein Lser_V15G29984 [Lactuca serriola]